MVTRSQTKKRKRENTTPGPSDKRSKTSAKSNPKKKPTKGEKKAKRARQLAAASAGSGQYGSLLYIRNVPILPKLLLPPLPFISDPRLAAEAVRRFSAGKGRDYYMLAMIGDAQAEVFMREYAYKLVPRINNGLTTRINSDIARNTTWAQLSLQYNLPSTLTCGSEKDAVWLRNKPKIQADLFEAHVGAVWMSFNEKERDVGGTSVLRQYFKALLDQLYPMFLAAHRMKDAVRQRYHAKKHNSKPALYTGQPLGQGAIATDKAGKPYNTDAADKMGYAEDTEDTDGIEDTDDDNDTDDPEEINDPEDWESSDFSVDSHYDEGEESKDWGNDKEESLDEDDEWYEIIGTNITSLQ